MSNRRCPRCQTTYDPPARFCVKDGSLLVESAPGARAEDSDASVTARPPDFSATLGSLTGQVLDQRYQINRKLGEGGMSYVYQAQEIATG